MKSLLVLLAAVFAPVLALAQQAPAPSPTPNSTPAPAAAASPSPSATPAGNAHDAAATVPLPGQPSGPNLEKTIPLIPENAPSGSRSAHSGRAHGGASPHATGTFEVEHDIRVRIQMRQVETRALNDPSLQADWAAAHAARTDPQRRALLAVYYNHLYDRMIKLDPSVAEHANARRQASLERMKYTRLGDLDNSEDPFAATVPEASGPNPPNSETSAPPTP